MAIFTQKPTSPGFPYPEAAPGMGYNVRYPASGPAHQTSNPYGRAVISRTGVRGKPHPRQYVIPDSVSGNPNRWLRRQALYRWLASYWAHTLSAGQKSAWAAYLVTANASSYPPKSWRYGTLLTNGFQMFIFFNSCNELMVQLQFQPIDGTLAAPFPNPPAAWTPPVIQTWTFQISFTPMAIFGTYYIAPAAQVWAETCLSIPGRTNSLFLPPQSIRTEWQNNLPGEVDAGGFLYGAWFEQVPPGTLFTASLRLCDQVNNCPSQRADFQFAST